MSQPAPDHALRRMVADMAALHADDMAAILNELHAGGRQTVEGLLHDYASYADIGEAPVPGDRIAYDASKLSPWLIQRLQAADEPGYDMTAQVRHALRDCVTRLYPASSAAIPGARRRLRGRKTGMFSQRRRAT